MDDAPRPEESDASEAGEALPLALTSEGSLTAARPSWTGPLVFAAASTAGGALGAALVLSGGVLGGVAAVAAGGALVSGAWRHNSGEAVEMEGEEVQVTNVQVTNVPQEAIANDPNDPNGPNGSNGSNDLPQNQSHQSPHGERLQSYAEGLLMERSLVERLRLLQQLHNSRDEASLQQMCATEGLAWLGTNSMGCFVRRHGEQSEVFFLGSEADFQSRPEEFTTCWLHTNARIQLQPLDAAICHDMIPGAHVHTGFQSSYLSIADELLGALREATGPLCIVGYSLGGALGTLAALQLCCRGFTQIDLITFGSPRVGNESFRDCFTERCLRPNYVRMARYVNTLDIVPHVPFNPEDVDSTRQGQLWRRVEEALTIPQQQLTGGSSSDHGNYVHVVPPTVLDGLSSSVAGVVSRLASIAAESERLRLAAAVPIEIVAEHGLSKYVCTLQEASRPAWLCLSNRLLAAGSPMHNALLEFQARRVQNSSVAVNPSWGIAMASGAAEATSAGIAGLLLPQLLSSAVSALGCYCVAQRVNQVSEHLREHTVETARSNEELQMELQQLKSELSNAHGSVVNALQDLSQFLRRRSCDDLLRRSRVAQRHLWEELEVFLSNPEAGHAQMVREACGEVRKAANEVLEMIGELEVDHVGEASELAGHWQVVLSAYRLALWATATADPTNSALRATQALQNIVAPLGQFFWRHLETGQEPWLLGLERQRVHFLSVATALSSEKLEVFPVSDGDGEGRWFSCLGLDPGNLELRVQLNQWALRSALPIPVASQRWLEEDTCQQLAGEENP